MAMPRKQKVAVKKLFEMHSFEAVIRQVAKRLNCAGQFLQETESISLQEFITCVASLEFQRASTCAHISSKFHDFSPNSILCFDMLRSIYGEHGAAVD